MASTDANGSMPSRAPRLTLRVSTLTRRADFLRAAQARRQGMPGFLLQARRREDADAGTRIGFTCSKKIGNAVTRNRMKRRLRELCRAALPESGIAGADHVLIGRPGGNDILYAELGEHLTSALKRAAKKLAPKP